MENYGCVLIVKKKWSKWSLSKPRNKVALDGPKHICCAPDLFATRGDQVYCTWSMPLWLLFAENKKILGPDLADPLAAFRLRPGHFAKGLKDRPLRQPPATCLGGDHGIRMMTSDRSLQVCVNAMSLYCHAGTALHLLHAVCNHDGKLQLPLHYSDTNAICAGVVGIHWYLSFPPWQGSKPVMSFTQTSRRKISFTCDIALGERSRHRKTPICFSLSQLPKATEVGASDIHCSFAAWRLPKEGAGDDAPEHEICMTDHRRPSFWIVTSKTLTIVG